MDLLGQLLVGLRAILLQGGQQLDVEEIEGGDFVRPGQKEVRGTLGRSGPARHPGRNCASHSINIC